MKSKNSIIVIVVLTIAAAIVLRLVANKGEVEMQRTTAERSVTISVAVAPAEMRETSGVLHLVGSTAPFREVDIASEVSGKVVQANFSLGDFVQSGALLVRVDDTFRKLSVETAQLNFDKQKEDYNRFQVLHAGDAVTQTQLQEMQLAYENAKIQLENAQKQLADTRIKAPFSGYISARNVELGSFVNPGTVIATLTDISRLKVDLTVSENTVYQLQRGQAVSVRSDIFPEEVFAGTIVTISPSGSDIHTYPIEILIDNKNEKQLKAGSFVTIQVILGQSEQWLMIPRSAIVNSVKDAAVYVIRGGTAHLAPIVVGQNYDTFVEVLSGISAGDHVVTEGQINLFDGAEVTITNK
ncbi:MAG: efflux RND transporter periplasmic adaptor subunit [Bacteroidales bacterium]|jgi:RND family efflux transporter MFP subunit|nr:efflux RND transporter periplasmic adaptor subunit [Bacteroidales bacterium]